MSSLAGERGAGHKSDATRRKTFTGPRERKKATRRGRDAAANSGGELGHAGQTRERGCVVYVGRVSSGVRRGHGASARKGRTSAVKTRDARMRGVKMGLVGSSVCVCSTHARGCGVCRGRRVLYGRADAGLGQSGRDEQAIVRRLGAFDELSQEDTT